jgi:hypothetical protein
MSLVHPHQVVETAKLITVELWQQVLPIDDREADSSPAAVYALDLIEPPGGYRPELSPIFGGDSKASVLVAGVWTLERHFEASQVLRLNAQYSWCQLKSMESPLLIVALAAVVEREVTPPTSLTAPEPYKSPDPGF